MHRKTLFSRFFAVLVPMAFWTGPPPSLAKIDGYLVQRGDCLWNISKKLWKDPLRWPLIHEANAGRIRNPNLIYPGQRFAIPPPSSLTRAEFREVAKKAYAKLAPLTHGRSVERSAPLALDGSPPPSMGSAPIRSAAAPRTTGPPSDGGPIPSKRTSVPGVVMVMTGIFLALVGGVFWVRRKTRDRARPIQEPLPLAPVGTHEEPAHQEPPMKSGTITSISIPTAPSRPGPDPEDRSKIITLSTGSPNPPPTPVPPPPTEDRKGDPSPSDPTHHAA